MHDRLRLLILVAVVIVAFTAWAVLVFTIVHGDCTSVPTFTPITHGAWHGYASSSCAELW